MDLIFSNVGFQPSAIAVTVASWMAHTDAEPNNAVLVLMHTDKTHAAAERLREWATGQPAIRSVDLLPVSTGMLDSPEAPAPRTRVSEQIRRHPQHRPVFCGDPGLNVQVVSAQRGLTPPYVRLHASDRELEIADTRGDDEPEWRRAPLVDLGLRALLMLADAQIDTHAIDKTYVAALPEELRQALRQLPPTESARLRAFMGAAIGVPHAGAVMGYERRGQLHLLVRLRDPQRGDKSIVVSTEVGHLRQRFRPLKPWILALSVSEEVREHLQTEYGITGKDPSSFVGVMEWLTGQPPRPGHALGSPEDQGFVTPDPYDAQASDPGLTDITLVVCLGIDPSPTLISICTHRPSRLIIVFDKSTPRVRALARALRDAMPGLPVAQARFLASDRLGAGIVAGYLASPADFRARVLLDITPGTKGQACEMARLTHADIWSTQGDQGLATRLTGAGERSLQGAPLLLWTRVAHGPLTNDRPPTCSPCNNPDHAPFLRAMHHALLPALRRPGGPRGLAELLGALSTDDRSPVWNHDQCFGITTYPTRFVALTAVGSFFEELVVEALCAIGPDEICTNITWRWSASDSYRRELDIALRLGHRLVAISCKSSGGRTSTTAAALREIEALAEAAFGRFTLPVLVRTRFTHATKVASLAHGAVLLDLVDLADPGRVRDILATAFARRSTVS